MDQELRFETHSVGEGDRVLRLYECPHITQNTFPIALAICIGDDTNLLLCRHCWAGIRGLVSEELLRTSLQQIVSSNRTHVVNELVRKAVQAEKEGQGEAA